MMKNILGIKNTVRASLWLLATLTLLALSQVTLASADLVDISTVVAADNKTEITVKFSGSVDMPASFVIQEPNPSIILDFNNVRSKLKQSNTVVNLGVVNQLSAIEADGRTRLVLDVNSALTKDEFNIRQGKDGRSIVVLVNGLRNKSKPSSGNVSFQGRKQAIRKPFSIMGVDFRRSDQGGGKIIIKVSSPDINVDVQEKSEVIVLDFLKTALPQKLQRRLDVTDFDTPVRDIELRPYGSGTRITIQSKGFYQHLTYQMGHYFIVNVRPMNDEERKIMMRKNKQYSGERISLNFQDIKVRAVLQLLAEFTGLNMVVSDSVSGSITLRLKDVPWDQALDIVLKTQGLTERRFGNIIMVAPTDEMAAREKQELEAEQQVEDLSPLHSELIQINYAKGDEIAKLLKAKDVSILSERGSVTVDNRTNAILVRDTSAKLNEVREFLKKLDVPVKQVLIKSRIVNVKTTSAEDLGVLFGLHRRPLTGTLNGSNSLQQTGADFVELQAVPITQRLNVDLPADGVGSANGSPSIGIAVASLGDNTFLDLELSALESEGSADVIASPTEITSDQQQAVIEQGVEIPYQQASSSGATTVAFKKAVLSLEVTPQITPDDRVILTLRVNQDSPGERVLGVPAIDTRNIKTKVLVNNGETIVLGGIYQENKSHTITRVPFLGNLPVVGRLFRRNISNSERTELLIFITPKILKEGLTATS